MDPNTDRPLLMDLNKLERMTGCPSLERGLGLPGSSMKLMVVATVYDFSDEPGTEQKA